jgi:enamine deaminase RidA (YjgF/YER057c/UK114 family)
MTNVEHVTSPDLFASPPPIAHAVRAGTFVVVSGQVPRWPDGGVPEGIEEQVELALANLVTALAAAGRSLEDVVFLRTYATDRETLRTWVRLRRDRFGAARPAATSVVVVGLADERWRIEIEAVAWAGS